MVEEYVNSLLSMSALFILSVIVIMFTEQIEEKMVVVKTIYSPGPYCTVCRSLTYL